jgi:superfamily I DNA/RNA helicase
MVSRGDPAGEIADLVLLETGLAEQYGSGEVTDQARRENLEEFRRFAAQYDIERPRGGLTGFLMEQSLMTTQDSYSGQGLALMTLHCAKGWNSTWSSSPAWRRGCCPTSAEGRGVRRTWRRRGGFSTWE